MKENIERSLWAILVCMLCVILAMLFTSSVLFGGNSGDVVAQFSPISGS